MIRLLLPFAAGILLSFTASDAFDLRRFGPLIAVLALLSTFLALRPVAHRRRWLPGFFISLTLLTTGYALGCLQDERNWRDHFHHIAETEAALAGRVLAVSERGERTRVHLAVYAGARRPEAWRARRGYLVAYLAQGDRPHRLLAGDSVLIYAQVRLAEPPLNPKSFDYARYLHLHNRHYTAFVGAGRWRILGRRRATDLRHFTGRLRERGLRVLRRALPDEEAFAVGSALTLGYKEELSDQLRDAYSRTGAMHVLAVSGLHVGMICLAGNLLLGLLPVRRWWWRPAKSALLLVLVWLFALVTGASSSVLRAAAMFSIVIGGGLFRRDANIYNTLAASACLLLVLDPYRLLDVGFQLSYLAVLGIVYFQPRIYRRWYLPHRVGRYLWNLTSVALAAQISTLLISLYYFHQFPAYFWLSGLLVVPGAAVILGLALLLFATAALPVVGAWVGALLNGVIQLMNGAIFRIEQLPGAYWQGIWISGSAVLGLYALLLLIVAALETRRFRWLLAALTLALLLTGSHAYTLWRAHRQQTLVVYAHRRHTVIDLFSGRQVIGLQDAPLTEKERAFTNQAYRWFRRPRIVEQHLLTDTVPGTAGLCYQDNQLAVGGRRLYLADGPLPPDLAADLLLIRGDPSHSLPRLLNGNCPEQVLWDSSNRPFRSRRWAEQCRTLGLDCYDISARGAFILDLSPNR